MKQLRGFFLYLREKNWRALLLLFLVTFTVHSPVLFNGYNLDDELVTRNHRLTSKGISAIPEIYKSPYYEDDMGYSYGYRPTVLASFAIEHELFGESPFVGHLINLLLYALTVIVIFSLILNLFPGQWWLAFGTAILFAVHPIHTEVVASIKNRDEILSMLLGLIGIALALRKSSFVVSILLGIFVVFLALTSKVSGLMVILLIAMSTSQSMTLPKRLFISLVLTTVIVFVLYIRGSLAYQSNGIILLIVVLAVLNLLSKSNFCLTIYTQTKKTLNQILFILRSVIRIPQMLAKRFIENLNSSFTTVRKLEITLSLIATLLVLHIQNGGVFDYISDYLLVLVILISFFLIPSSTLDAFFRFSVVLMFSESWTEYNYFLIVSVGLMSLKSSKKMVALRVIIALVIAITFQSVLFPEDWADPIGTTAFHLGLILFYLLSNKIISISRFILFSLTVATAGVVGWEISGQDGLFYAIATGFPVWLKMSQRIFRLTKASLNRFSEKLLSNRLFKYALFVATLYLFSSPIHPTDFHVSVNSIVTDSFDQLEGVFAGTDKNLFHLNEYHPSEIWSAEHILSWKRPFDYVEHPLSPFAPLAWQLGTALTTLKAYFTKLLVPFPLAYYYGFDEVMISNLWQLESIVSLLFHLILGLGIIFFWSRSRAISIGLIMYLSSIALFSGMAEMVAGMFADRYAYVASFGFSLAVVGIVIYLSDRYPKSRLFLKAIAVVVLFGFSAYSFHRDTLWKDKVTLMRNDIKNVPNSAQAHNLLAHALMEDVFDRKNKSSATEKEQQIIEAEHHFSRATEIYPFFFNAWVDKGKVNEQLNKPEEVIECYQQALSIDSTYTPLFNWIGKNFELLGNYNKAAEYYQNYLLLHPNDFVNYDNLARVLFRQNKFDEAIRVCEEYLKMDSSNQIFIDNIAFMKQQMENADSFESNAE